MAKYLIMLKSKHVLARLEADHLQKFKDGIQAAMQRGTIEGAYAKVGGGLVLIVDSPSNAQLTVELRKNQITDAEVIPLVSLVDLLDAHIEHRQTGVVKV
jgi:hypothetical protein